MSERTTHTIYLGDGKRMAVAVEDQCKGSNPSLTIDAEGRGVIALVPQTIAPLRVELKLLKEGDSIADVKPTLAWEMVADSIDGEPPYWADGVHIHGAIPMAADWHESRIRSQFDGGLPHLTQNPIPREIPAGKSDVLPDDEISVVTTSLVPGERIWAEHDYLLTEGVGTVHQFFRTLSMVGGEVTAKTAHPTISGLFTYTVDAAGSVISGILPSDYYPYQVGDWVYLLTLSADATSQVRDVLKPPDKTEGAVRLAPYQINNRGAFPAIKSYLHNDFTRWANLRILTGTVTAIADNRASVLLDETGQTLTDITVRYFCNKQSFEHQHTAIHAGDSVLVAYDGYRSDPSQNNCYIIGQTGTVDRCSTGGILALLRLANNTETGDIYGYWLFEGNSATQELGDTNAGNCWWTDGVNYISWDVVPEGKFAVQSITARNIYMDNNVVAVFSENYVAAAALRRYDETTEVLVVGQDCSVWKKTLFSGSVYSGWVRLREKSFSDPYLNIPAVFNSSATECSAIKRNFETVFLCTWTINGDSAIFSATDQLYRIPVGGWGTQWKYPIAVDYNGDQRIVATIEYRHDAPDSSESTGTPSKVWDDGTPETMYDIFAYSYSSLSTSRQSIIVDIGNTEHVVSSITSQEQRSGTTYDMGLGYGHAAWVGTISMNHTPVLGVIEGINLRENTVAIYQRSAATFTSRSSTSSGLPYDPETGSFIDNETGEPFQLSTSYNFSPSINVTRSKKINNTVLLEKSMTCAALHSPSHAHQSSLYAPSINSENGFDTLPFSSATGLVWTLGEYNENYLAYLSPRFHKVRRGSDLLTIWRLAYDETYASYSGGNVEALTGLTGPLFAEPVKVV